MQKNIVSSVNAAMAKAGGQKEKQPVSASTTSDFAEIRQELDSLREENVQFAAAVDEMRAQNEELRSKIDQLLSAQKSTPKNSKKKKSSSKK